MYSQTIAGNAISSYDQGNLRSQMGNARLGEVGIAVQQPCCCIRKSKVSSQVRAPNGMSHGRTFALRQRIRHTAKHREYNVEGSF